MKILDCETLESTYKSIEIIMGFDKIQLESIFAEFVLNELGFMGEELFLHVRKCGASKDFDRICWFHSSRIMDTADFSKGILPLHLGIETIWGILYSLIDEGVVSEDEWTAFKQLMNEGQVAKNGDLCSDIHSLYQLKTQNKYLEGPYAWLIKEISIEAKAVGVHDHLEIPEIIQDICRFFRCFYDYDLAAKFKSKTKPCIVKFTTDKYRHDLLPSALAYVYSKYKGIDLSKFNYSGFNGEGNLISEENILSVTWLCINNKVV